MHEIVSVAWSLCCEMGIVCDCRTSLRTLAKAFVFHAWTRRSVCSWPEIFALSGGVCTG
jgi:hypothetical protein